MPTGILTDTGAAARGGMLTEEVEVGEPSVVWFRAVRNTEAESPGRSARPACPAAPPTGTKFAGWTRARRRRGAG
jgi:hypothetical protein